MTIGKFETLFWRDGALHLIDQRVLPTTVRYLRCTSAAEAAAAIHDMVVRGAPAIGCAAAYGVALEAKRLLASNPDSFHPALRAAMTSLVAARPTAVNLAWAVARMQKTLEHCGDVQPHAIAKRLLEEAHAIWQEDIECNRKMGTLGAQLVPDHARILTHCNAGALATAGHGTALGVIRSAAEAGKSVQVFADETRPFLQGARLTAWELMQDGIPVTLIADVSAGYLISSGEVDLIIVGADRVAANGDTANKIGTYPLAVLAQRHRVPFYVACPWSTIDLSTPSGKQIPIEERGDAEVMGFREVQWAPDGVKVRNPAFDVTPAELITAIITERGVIEPPFGPALSRLSAQDTDPASHRV
ncbi:MAG TPA: S-methyl-5-thioribose-1-phosphate isomerase [Burkholderiales bacterium]|nr:S-methyl-5-thioribose-1-phosphate isomerase [Burkholderiales bacterium]